MAQALSQSRTSSTAGDMAGQRVPSRPDASTKSVSPNAQQEEQAAGVVTTGSASRLGRAEGERDSVHAIPQACWHGTVVEYVAEVSPAAATQHFRAIHPETLVGSLDDGMVEGFPEAGPSGATVELGRRGEQIQCAARAAEHAGAMFVIERAGERSLGTGVTEYVVLLGSQQVMPFGVGMGDFKGARRRGGWIRRCRWTHPAASGQRTGRRGDNQQPSPAHRRA
jgi:hypothetical protein